MVALTFLGQLAFRSPVPRLAWIVPPCNPSSKVIIAAYLSAAVASINLQATKGIA